MSVFKLGLTGSIGMGKSTTARMFEDAGCALWDADAAVHRLYAAKGLAVAPVAAIFPEAIVDDGVSRTQLKSIIARDREALARIEAIVHPLVAQDRENFIVNQTDGILVFDIPLLFETGGDANMDAVACVTVPPDEQERRVLERGTMSHADFARIRDKQMPNAEKVARADYVILTDTLEHARRQVHDVIKDIERKMDA